MPLVNYRFALPFRRASATFIWPARFGIYRACEFRRVADLSNYTDRRPLSAPVISAMSRISDAPPVNERSEHHLNAYVRFVRSSEKLSSGYNRLRWSPSHRCDLQPDTTSGRFGASLGINPSIQLAHPQLLAIHPVAILTLVHNCLTRARRSPLVDFSPFRAPFSPSNKYLSSSRLSRPIRVSVSIIASLIRARPRRAARHVFPRNNAQVLPRVVRRSWTRLVL